MSGTLNMPPRVTMAQAPVRPLPVRIRLFPDETTRSLLRRLETANALHRGELKKTLRATRKPWIETISEWSGDSPERLTFAMPQLGSKNRVILDHDKLTGRPDRHTSGTACHRCSLAHGAGQYVEIYTTHERVLCPRHGLWIGDGAPQPTDQLSIRACPVIDAAWHHHINLIERRGHARMRTAFYISGVINWRWYDQFLHFTHTTDIYETLAADQPRHARSQAIVAASLYPATVELAAAIASPYWADIAHSIRPDQFLDRIGNSITEGWQPRGASDPLRGWMDNNWGPEFHGSDTIGPRRRQRSRQSGRAVMP